MKREDVLKGLKERFAGDILEFSEKSPKRLYIEIKAESIKKVALYLYKDLGCRFNIASGMDMRRHFEILYHFLLEDLNVQISLRVKLLKPSKMSSPAVGGGGSMDPPPTTGGNDLVLPEIDSLAPLFEAANWVERELHELLGLNFRGHPDLRKLLLPDDWPQGVYPLRQDYKEWDPNAIRDRGV
jgi:Ni,Fe-hydrogenase III component G